MSVLTLLAAHYDTALHCHAVPFNLFSVEKSLRKREQFTIYFLSRLALEVGEKCVCFYRKLESSFTKFIFQVNDEETAIHRIPFGTVKQYRISSPSSCYITGGRTWRTSHLALLGQTWSPLNPPPPTCSILILKF